MSKLTMDEVRNALEGSKYKMYLSEVDVKIYYNLVLSILQEGEDLEKEILNLDILHLANAMNYEINEELIDNYGQYIGCIVDLMVIHHSLYTLSEYGLINLEYIEDEENGVIIKVNNPRKIFKDIIN